MTAAKQVVHKSYEMGVAPYKLRGIWSGPGRGLLSANPTAYNAAMKTRPACCHSSCDHCGTYIIHHFIIEDSNGQQFAVGSSCIGKLNDTMLLTQVKIAQRKRAKEAREAKRKANAAARQAKFESKLEEERLANGGMTDYELEIETRKAREIVTRQYTSEVISYFYEALENSSSYFCIDVKYELKKGELPRGRGITITKEIAAKYHSGSRKNSKKYKAELENTELEWNKMVLKLADIKSKVANMSLVEIKMEYPEYFI